MRARFAARVALMALAMLGAFAARPSAQTINITAGPMDLVELYLLGEHVAVRDALATAARGELSVVLEAFTDEADDWIDLDGPEWRVRRRLAVATVALETAYAGLDRQWVHARALVVWACGLMRDADPSPAERDWHLAALALIEGARDFDLLGDHAAHIRRRFPDEPRLLLVEAFQREKWFLDEVTYLGVEHGPGRRTDLYDEALAHPAVAREARLRSAYLLLQANRFDEALEQLRWDGPADDPGQEYLARLFEGWIHLEREPADPDAARAAFRAALAVLPNAYSATLALALELYRIGDIREANDMVYDLAHADAPVIDPWQTYGYGDLRRWPQLVARLRRHLR